MTPDQYADLYRGLVSENTLRVQMGGIEGSKVIHMLRTNSVDVDIRIGEVFAGSVSITLISDRTIFVEFHPNLQQFLRMNGNE